MEYVYIQRRHYPEVFIKHKTVVINWAYEELLYDMKVIIHEEKKNLK